MMRHVRATRDAQCRPVGRRIVHQSLRRDNRQQRSGIGNLQLDPFGMVRNKP